MQCREAPRRGRRGAGHSKEECLVQWSCNLHEESRRISSLMNRAATLAWSSFCIVIMCASLVAPAMAANYAPEARTMGINYGRLADNIPNGATTVQLIKGLGMGRVRIFDFDAATIQAFAGSDLELTIGMGNLDIAALADATAADNWIAANVVPYYPATNITCITVGNELFTYPEQASIWPSLVPAITNLYNSLQNRGLTRIKVSTAVEYSVLAASFPPSKGVFREEIAQSVMKPLLAQLDSTSSYLYVNVYPYFGWASAPADIPLDYALFTRPTVFTTDASSNGAQQYDYTNLLDAQLDAMAAAMEAVGYGDVRIVVSETGWPTMGDATTLGANITNAQTYNNNLVKWALNNPTKGTPRRPGIFVPTYIFAVYNENQKPGPTTERNWGVLYPSGKAVYPLDVSSSASGGGSSSGGGGGASQPKTCNGRPSVLSLSASFFGILFNLRI
ncbi:hypothetical protein KC19_4G230400 [Ceratodon purpureus]|uniref:glucan endo-1,3-beta-D-glucosidase n=1 Tax=Ceratodon purpureus TaxID=3225 RepID=A0A8T0IBS0_CERPU|nr:hypothetical protein KC19_4G230400 [Ceratodon purpureus]